MERPVIALSLILTGFWLLVGTPAPAEASVTVGKLAELSLRGSPAPLAPECEHRSAAHLAEHGGRAADDAYHLSRGELPACDEQSDNEHKDSNDQDDKSRYCRKHWFC